MVKIEMLMRGVRGKTQDKGRRSLATKGIPMQGMAGDTDRLPPPLVIRPDPHHPCSIVFMGVMGMKVKGSVAL